MSRRHFQNLNMTRAYLMMKTGKMKTQTRNQLTQFNPFKGAYLIIIIAI